MTADILYLPTATPAHAALHRLAQADLHDSDATVIRAGLDRVNYLSHPSGLAKEPVRSAIIALAKCRHDLNRSSVDFWAVRRELVPDAAVWRRVCEAVDAYELSLCSPDEFAAWYTDRGTAAETDTARHDWETRRDVALTTAVDRRFR